jgi:hypothetical protein
MLKKANFLSTMFFDVAPKRSRTLPHPKKIKKSILFGEKKSQRKTDATNMQ